VAELRRRALDAPSLHPGDIHLWQRHQGHIFLIVPFV
jgi:hypothetical protein